MIQYLISLFSALPNSTSMMRMALVNILIMDYLVLFVWIGFSIKEGEIVDIGTQIANVVGMINGAGFVGKGVQSFAERKSYQPPKKTDEGEAD